MPTDDGNPAAPGGWREGLVLGEARPTIMADLGYGVMAAAILEKALLTFEVCVSRETLHDCW